MSHATSQIPKCPIGHQKLKAEIRKQLELSPTDPVHIDYRRPMFKTTGTKRRLDEAWFYEFGYPDKKSGIASVIHYPGTKLEPSIHLAIFI
ncbi:hypothetical protein OKA05_03010 [Luteolibacter arcticus]|uniref:Uncharacterized protein n=1 Tax=Luteolibacter arcticus TaxID=1581411 RepID=A0ABT3GD17_9BACT|nr:hypothetical protein [Luteolibacter arcticus]MCW1921506.1 hypothetical protein [Luteolibacter arcticus]